MSDESDEEAITPTQHLARARGAVDLLRQRLFDLEQPVKVQRAKSIQDAVDEIRTPEDVERMFRIVHEELHAAGETEISALDIFREISSEEMEDKLSRLRGRLVVALTRVEVDTLSKKIRGFSVDPRALETANDVRALFRRIRKNMHDVGQDLSKLDLEGNLSNEEVSAHLTGLEASLIASTEKRLRRDR